jgi:CDP-diacylglycerol--serine O-phosphatidyltransferase
LFLIWGLLDYLNGALARERVHESRLGLILDPLIDFPLLLALSYACLPAVPVSLLAGNVLLELVMILVGALGREKGGWKVRTGIHFTLLFSMLLFGLGSKVPIATPLLISQLLWINIAYTTVAALYSLDVLQKRFIADALSFANLLCGVFSMLAASRGAFSLSLLFLLVGGAFDGFDGAAARKWGGTRMGVYSDDIADGVNYGIAPGVALAFALHGIEGWTVGLAFSLFTVSRLVFFTLDKDYADPNFFRGVPSTIGGIITLCSIILFKEHPAILGLMVGAACMLMVSFDTQYRHLGRALSANRRIIYGMPILIVLLLLAQVLWHQEGMAAVILMSSLMYGLFPMAAHFAKLFAIRG